MGWMEGWILFRFAQITLGKIEICLYCLIRDCQSRYGVFGVAN